MAEPYVPVTEPFWTDSVFAVWEIREGHYVASRTNGAVHFRGSLQECARWIERDRKKK